MIISWQNDISEHAFYLLKSLNKTENRIQSILTRKKVTLSGETFIVQLQVRFHPVVPETRIRRYRRSSRATTTKFRDRVFTSLSTENRTVAETVSTTRLVHLINDV